MPYDYQWPEPESFSSAFACKILPRTGKAQSAVLQNAFLDPVLNLFGFQKPVAFVVSWALLAVVWLLVYYVLPVWVWNSSDGQDRNVSRSFLGAFIVYYIFTFLLVAYLAKGGCTSLMDQAKEFLYGNALPLDRTLIASAQELTE